jgi:hypothetical protein
MSSIRTDNFSVKKSSTAQVMAFVITSETITDKLRERELFYFIALPVAEIMKRRWLNEVRS